MWDPFKKSENALNKRGDDWYSTMARNHENILKSDAAQLAQPPGATWRLLPRISSSEYVDDVINQHPAQDKCPEARHKSAYEPFVDVHELGDVKTHFNLQEQGYHQANKKEKQEAGEACYAQDTTATTRGYCRERSAFLNLCSIRLQNFGQNLLEQRVELFGFCRWVMARVHLGHKTR